VAVRHDTEGLALAEDVMEHRPVWQHHRLRAPGRPGRVDQRDQVVRPAARRDLVAAVRGVERDHLLGGKARREGMLAVARVDDHELGRGVATDLIQAGRRIAWIEDDERLARLDHAERRHTGRGVVGHEVGHTACARAAPTQDGARQVVGRRIELREGELLTDAGYRDGVGAPPDLFREALREGSQAAQRTQAHWKVKPNRGTASRL
jgi:hypothetical protein